MTTGMTVDSMKQYTLPIIAVVVLILMVPLLILPWFSDVQVNLKTISERQTKLSALETKADALEKLDSQSNKDTLTQQVEPAIPSQADPSGLLGTLEQVAILSGTSTRGVSYGQSNAVAATATDGTTGGKVSTSLSIQGDYANIVSFITQTESVKRVVSLDTLHIVLSSDGESALTATFDVSAPYQPLLTDLGPAEEPLPESTQAKQSVLTLLSTLKTASYAPTAKTDITGKPNPF